jgi:hypothetical protein
MATKRPAKPRRTLLQKAADPATDPERLRELARSKSKAVSWAAMMNPSLPEKAWRKFLFRGFPEPWANPMAPLYLLAWTPREEDQGSTLEYSAAAWGATCDLWEAPERCSPEGKDLIAAKIQEGWAISEDADTMMRFLVGWAHVKGKDSPEHREVVRIFILCVRTAPNLTTKASQALDLLEGWCREGTNRIKKDKKITSFKPVLQILKFLENPSNIPLDAIFEVLVAVEVRAGTRARAEHSRMLANLIRQSMPLPPVVD